MKTKHLSNLFIFSLALLIFAFSARAATYTVTNTNNDGAGSLRDAINTANSTAANDTINFNIAGCANIACTIQLSVEQLVVYSAASSGSLTIFNSTGADRLSVKGSTVYPPGLFRVLAVSGGANLTIDGVTFTSGGANDLGGGCISNGGNLTLKNSVVTGCLSTGGAEFGNGGGIYNTSSAVLSLIKTTIAGNLSDGSFGGGGIYNNGGIVTITDSIVSGNNNGRSALSNGGGINNAGGTMTIIDSTFHNNSSSNGGGIYNTGNLTITNSNFFGNVANGGGGIFVGSGTANVTNSVINNNIAYDGGGGVGVGGSANLILDGSTVSRNKSVNGGGIEILSGIATIKNSLIDGNSYLSENGGGLFGGGIYNFAGLMTLINTTVSRNVAGIDGSGISNSSQMYIINSTITLNYVTAPEYYGGAGIVNLSQIWMRNSIVAENIAGYAPDLLNFGSFTSNGNNLIGNTETDTPVSWQSSDILNQSPRLAPLGNYGGATQVFALTNNSPALNHGNNCVVTLNGCGDNNPAIPTDQRGASRVGIADIGAFELNNTANGGTFRAVTTEGRLIVPYTYPLTFDSGNFTYSVTAGSLPLGLSITNSLTPQAGAYSIAGTPLMSGTFDYTITATDGTNSVSTNYRTVIQAVPTAANVSVGGRVTAQNRVLANAQVVLTDENGNSRTVRTGAFGYFNFEDVPAGATYVIRIAAKRYRFAPQIVSPTDDLTDLTFTAAED